MKTAPDVPATPSPRRKIERTKTKTPGPTTEITLRLAEMSVPLLLDGQPATRVQLCDNGDGTYGLRADGKIGEIRATGVKPAIDVLVEMVNTFADALYDQQEDAGVADVPTAVLDAFEKFVDDWTAYGKREHAPPNFGAHVDDLGTGDGSL